MRAISVLLLLAAAVFAAGCRSAEERKAEHKSRAEAYVEKEQWSEANIEYMNLLELDPGDAEAHYARAEVLWKLEEYHDALWDYKEAVRLQPDNQEWRFKYAQVEFAAQRYDVVKEQLDALLERDPNHVRGILLLAAYHSTRGEQGDSLAATERALALEPENPAALGLHAQELVRKGDYKNAETSLRKLIEVDPRPQHHIALARFLDSLERHDEAEVTLRSAIDAASADSDRVAARVALANFLLSRDRADEAEKVMLQAREEAPNDTEILFGLARFYHSRGEAAKAEEMLEARVVAQPESAEPLLVLSDYYQRTDDTPKALAAVDRALEREPNSEQARLKKAVLLMDRNDAGDKESARQLLNEVLEENPASTLGLFTEAKFLIAEEKYEEAAMRLRRVIDEQPSANAHMLLGTTYVKLEQYDLGRSELLQALQLEPQNHLARTQLAALYLREGERNLAVQEAQTALRQRPNDARLLLLAAEGLSGLGRVDEARDALRKLKVDEVESAPFRLQVASLHRRTGGLGDARRILDELWAKNPADNDVLGELVLLDIQARDPERALERLDAAIQALPDDPVRHEMRGRVRLSLMRDGKHIYGEAGEKDLLEAIEKGSKSNEPYLLLGRYYYQTGRKDDALAIFDKGAKARPDDGRLLFERGSLLEQLGRVPEARESYEAVLRVDQGNGVAMNNLAWLLANQESPSAGDLDRALELAQDAKELLPENPSVADTLGYVMLKKDIPAAAISLFREAIGRFPDGVPVRCSVRYHLALAHERNGEPDRAMKELRGALDECNEFPERASAQQRLKDLESGGVASGQ